MTAKRGRIGGGGIEQKGKKNLMDVDNSVVTAGWEEGLRGLNINGK